MGEPCLLPAGRAASPPAARPDNAPSRTVPGLGRPAQPLPGDARRRVGPSGAALSRVHLSPSGRPRYFRAKRAQDASLLLRWPQVPSTCWAGSRAPRGRGAHPLCRAVSQAESGLGVPAAAHTRGFGEGRGAAGSYGHSSRSGGTQAGLPNARCVCDWTEESLDWLLP